MGPSPGKRVLKVAAATTFLLFASSFSFGQSINPAPNAPKAQAQETLTVTLSVVSSVEVIIGTHGQQRIVVANAAAASDNVSSVHYVRLNEVKSSSGVLSPARRELCAEGTREIKCEALIF